MAVHTVFRVCLRVVAGLLALVWCAGRSVSSGRLPGIWLVGPFRLGAVSCILWCILTCCHMLAVAVGLLVGAFAFPMLAWPHSLVRPSGVLLVPACLHFSFLCMVLRLYRISCTFPGLYRMSSLPVLSGLGSRLFVVAAGRLGVGVQPGALRGLPLMLMLAVFLFLPMLLVFSHLLAHLRFRPLSFSSRPFPVLCSLRGSPDFWLLHAVLPWVFQYVPSLLLHLGFPCWLLFQRFLFPSGSGWSLPFGAVHVSHVLLLVLPRGFSCMHICSGLLLDPPGGVPSFSSFGCPFPYFTLRVLYRVLCFCPWNFVPCNAVTSSRELRPVGSCCVPLPLRGLPCCSTLQWLRYSALSGPGPVPHTFSLFWFV